MRSSFFGLNVSVSGLFTAQRNLDVVNHNLSNATTPGYSRQQAVQATDTPMSLYDGTGMIGTGSRVTAVNRVRDVFLDAKYWSESTTSGEWDTKTLMLSEIEKTFNEPSDSGFTTIMNDFYNSLQELSKNPGSGAVRALVRQRGITMANYFNSLAIHFEKLQSDVNGDVKSKVDEVNSLATRILQLNKQIYTAELDGNAANDLRDARGLLVDQLSKIVNIEANEVVVGKLPDGRENRHFVITISGKALVDHYDASLLTVTQRTSKLNDVDVDSLYDVGWADGNKLDVKGGELKGYLDIRDGNNGKLPSTTSGYSGPLTQSPSYKGIPYYQEQLNIFVKNFAEEFNLGKGTLKGHKSGHGLYDTVNNKDRTGLDFFTMLGSNGKPIDTATFAGGYANITAKNFAVSADIMDNVDNIAVSDQPQEQGNTNVLKDLIQQRQDKSMFTAGTPEDFMKSLLAALGIDSQAAVRMSDNQDDIVKFIDTQRLSDSGVSIDEEMANLVKYQHAYNASAKMINTMADVYDTLINKLGVV
jgi:flagellar hook-associated protein 1